MFQLLGVLKVKYKAPRYRYEGFLTLMPLQNMSPIRDTKLQKAHYGDTSYNDTNRRRYLYFHSET